MSVSVDTVDTAFLLSEWFQIVAVKKQIIIFVLYTCSVNILVPMSDASSTQDFMWNNHSARNSFAGLPLSLTRFVGLEHEVEFQFEYISSG